MAKKTITVTLNGRKVAIDKEPYELLTRINPVYNEEELEHEASCYINRERGVTDEEILKSFSDEKLKNAANHAIAKRLRLLGIEVGRE